MPRDSTCSSKRRRFKVQSEFGNARGWRSRKNRPCDVCRKRKTVCVITTAPPFVGSGRVNIGTRGIRHIFYE
ncbi:uncharacterized protein ColSpa_04911 [Colletotrichum spaethianum]|uniref:Uncharacterized protein n=1 Tax=Colletotrichum spaethianum TaxID=700344 RepID=A0AA37LDT5_9PEZI|nr:uncharacterized protein ColSpa_04911 [Colletotrichum spaethianum]GKT44730.1 hypothetical protein ColSpa_04911 [Colletotrichum spaethianum]